MTDNSKGSTEFARNLASPAGQRVPPGRTNEVQKLTNPLPPNVSPEADAAFLAELHRTDPRRHARLMRSQRTFPADRWPAGLCSVCGRRILNAPFVRDGKQFCSRSCRDGVSESRRDRTKPRRYGTCLGCGRKFLTRRADNTTCSDRCRKAVSRRGSG